MKIKLLIQNQSFISQTRAPGLEVGVDPKSAIHLSRQIDECLANNITMAWAISRCFLDLKPHMQSQPLAFAYCIPKTRCSVFLRRWCALQKIAHCSKLCDVHLQQSGVSSAGACHACIAKLNFIQKAETDCVWFSQWALKHIKKATTKFR